MFKTQSNQMQKDISFKDDIKFFQSIPLSERSQYRKQSLSIPQKELGQYKPNKVEYPELGKWEYKGLQMTYHICHKTDKPKAIIFYFHGMNSHGGSSGYFARKISENVGEINVYSLDFLNHGRSASPNRGYVESFDSLIEQGELFMEFIKGKFKEIKPKIFLSGMSFGGSICFKISMKQKVDGCILFCPAIRQNFEHSPIMKKVGILISYVMPRTGLVNQSWNSATRYNMEQISKNDPYNYTGKVLPGSIRVILHGMDELSRLYSKFDVPYIVFQGGVDKLVDCFALLDLQMQSPSPDKTTYYCKDMWHAVFGQPEIDEIIEVTARWLNKRL